MARVIPFWGGNAPDAAKHWRLATHYQMSNNGCVTAEILKNELKTLPEADRTRIICGAMRELSPQALKSLERQLRRVAHPEVPEDVWAGFEEAEDGRGIEMCDEHFEQPPV